MNRTDINKSPQRRSTDVEKLEAMLKASGFKEPEKKEAPKPTAQQNREVPKGADYVDRTESKAVAIDTAKLEEMIRQKDNNPEAGPTLH